MENLSPLERDQTEAVFSTERSKRSLTESEIQALLAERLAFKLKADKLTEEMGTVTNQRDLYREVVKERDIELAISRAENNLLKEGIRTLENEAQSTKVAYDQGRRDERRLMIEDKKVRNERSSGRKVGQIVEQLLRKVFPNQDPWIDESREGLFARSVILVPKLVNATVAFFDQARAYLVNNVARPAQAYLSGKVQNLK